MCTSMLAINKASKKKTNSNTQNARSIRLLVKTTKENAEIIQEIKSASK